MNNFKSRILMKIKNSTCNSSYYIKTSAPIELCTIPWILTIKSQKKINSFKEVIIEVNEMYLVVILEYVQSQFKS